MDNKKTYSPKKEEANLEELPHYTPMDRLKCLFRKEFYMIIPNYVFFLIPLASLMAFLSYRYLDPFIASYIKIWKYGKNFPIPSPYNYWVSGIIIFLSGLGLLWVYSYLILEGEGGPCPPFTSKTKRLVTCGPYKYVRHPSILAKLFGVIGLGIAFRSLSFILIVVPLLLAGSLYNNRRFQEIPLEEKFGKEYIEYRQNTPALIPNPFKKKKG